MKILKFPAKIILSVIFLFNLSCSPVFQGKDREWTTTDITQNRDMSKYEQGGHFWCSTRPYGNEEDRLHGEKKVRDFIWLHMTERKRGYIKLTCAQIDTSKTTHYFIEPNEKDEWIVVRRALLQESNDQFKRNDDFLDSVERVESNDTNQKWILISKARNGEVIERLPRY